MELNRIGALDKRFTYDYFNSLINADTVVVEEAAMNYIEEALK
jgi:ribosomal protein L4